MLKKCQPLALVTESVMERGPIVEEAWRIIEMGTGP